MSKRNTHFLTLLDVDVHTVCIALEQNKKETGVTFLQNYITDVQIQAIFENMHIRTAYNVSSKSNDKIKCGLEIKCTQIRFYFTLKCNRTAATSRIRPISPLRWAAVNSWINCRSRSWYLPG